MQLAAPPHTATITTEGVNGGIARGPRWYEETAWLGAQTMATGVGAGDEEAVQAAIWTMTDDSANLAPPTATLTDSGNTELYRNRMPGHSWQLSDAGL